MAREPDTLDRFGAVDDRVQAGAQELLLGFHAGSMTGAM